MNQQPPVEGGPLGTLKVTNLAVAFLLELVLLAAVGLWGYTVGPNPLLKILLALGLPIGVAVVWGVFIAPRSVVKLPRLVNLGLRLLLFGLGALALGAAGFPTLAWIFAVVVVLCYILIIVWKQ